MDVIDKRLLFELDKNSRQPVTKLAKKLRLKRNMVEYRINQLVKNGIIRRFVTLFNPLAFNDQLYKIYLQLQNIDKKAEEEMIRYFQSLPLYWLAKSYGRWDFLVGIRANSPNEFNKIKLELLSKLEDHIINKNITMMVNAPFFDRDYLVGNRMHTNIKYFLEEIKIHLDEKDKQILQLLSTNARIKAVDISQKLKVTIKTVIEHIKKMEKSGVIIGYKISLNLEKIGYKHMKVFISLKNVSEKDHKRFVQYCMSMPNLIHLVECLGEWDFEPEFEIQNEKELYAILDNIRYEFSKIIKTIDVVTIVKEYEYKAY